MDRLSNNYRKGASFDAPFRAASLLADRALLAVLLGSICVFVLWPMVCIALRSFQDSGGGFTLDQYRTVWSSYGRSLGNSLFVGALTAFFCTDTIAETRALPIIPNIGKRNANAT